MSVKVSRKQAWPLVKGLFPDYNGRKFQIEPCETVTFYDTNWSGGTRSYSAFLKADGSSSELNVPAPWVNQVEGQTVQMRPDILVVKRSYFCGSDMGITIYTHPSNMPKLLAR